MHFRHGIAVEEKLLLLCFTDGLLHETIAEIAAFTLFEYSEPQVLMITVRYIRCAAADAGQRVIRDVSGRNQAPAISYGATHNMAPHKSASLLALPGDPD